MDLTYLHVAQAAAIGLAAGVVGGLAGIGGSLVMLPALGFFLGYDEPARSVQHLYMAAAMVVNAIVSAPATWTHARAGAVRRNLVVWILPPMTLAMIGGVVISDRVDGHQLIDFLAVFIGVYCVMNIVRALARTPETHVDPIDAAPLALVALGLATGLLGGLLGIGGGVVMVPALQLFLRVPLRNAIAASSAVMCVTALIGSGFKLAGLGEHSQSASDALLLAAAMGPTAFLGGLLGAQLVQKLPLAAVRLAISLILALAAARLALAHRPSAEPTPQAAPAESKEGP